MRIQLERICLLSVLFLTLATIGPVSADTGDYPRIRRAHQSDEIFRQHQEAVQEYYLRSRSGRGIPPPAVYRYQPEPEDTLLTLAARFSLPQSTLASINRLSTANIPTDTDFLLVPTIPGIYAPDPPQTDLEHLFAELRFTDDWPGASPVTLLLRPAGGATSYRFYPGDDFDRVERLAFLNILFRRPVENIRITSYYGYRSSPFGGSRGFHSGVDFAAPIGTPVRAAREGVVTATGFDPVFGTFVSLAHHGTYETFYGHLDTVLVRLNDVVSSSMIIGTVGNSGLSTGPHLHFEIRLNGETRDPAGLMPGLQR